MGDLPAAGAVWFGSDRQGPEVETAELAWRGRHGHDDLQLWLSLPPLVRSARATPAVSTLHAAAEVAATARRQAHRRVPRDAPLTTPKLRPGTVVAAAVGSAVAAVLIVGLVTIARWLMS